MDGLQDVQKACPARLRAKPNIGLQLGRPRCFCRFVTKPQKRQARRARGAVREGGILKRMLTDRTASPPARAQEIAPWLVAAT